MTKGNFLDLLRYYLSELPKGIVDEILEEYNLHFEEGKKQGKTEDEIANDLGSPKDIALEYLNYEKVAKEHTSRKNYRTKGLFRHSDTGEINWGMVFIGLLLSPIVLPMIFAFFAMAFALTIALVAIGVSVIVAGIGIILGTLFPFLPFISMGEGLLLLSPLTKVLMGLTGIVLGILLVNIFKDFIIALIEKIKNRGKVNEKKGVENE